MNTAAAIGLLLLVLMAWFIGSYRGERRAARSRLRAFVAERQTRQLTAEVAGLRAQLAEEEALLEHLPEPVILFGAGRSIRRLNAEARRTLGSGSPALLRMPAFRTALDEAAAEGREAFVDVTLAVPVSRELHVRVTPVDGARSRLVAVLSDRTRERAVERMRADFVANASHELRTPLASLIGFIDTLRGPAADDPEAQIRFLGIMAEQAQRMNRLIDDLLGLSRIELTEHMAPSGRVGIAGLIEATAAGLAPLVQARRTELQMALATRLDDVVGDADQLGQVLQNLVENAIKYGKDGGLIRVGAQAEVRAGVPGVAVSVRDDGIGIAATHLPRLTERFYRVNTHRSRAVGGTGLGLAIVKHIVNRHRGQLRIESVEGQGTTVTVWLPAAREPGEPPRV